MKLKRTQKQFTALDTAHKIYKGAVAALHAFEHEADSYPGSVSDYFDDHAVLVVACEAAWSAYRAAVDADPIQIESNTSRIKS